MEATDASAMDVEALLEGLIQEKAAEAAPEGTTIVLPLAIDQGQSKPSTKAKKRKRSKEELEAKKMADTLLISKMEAKLFKKKVGKMIKKRKIHRKRKERTHVVEKKPATEKQLQQRASFKSRVEDAKKRYRAQPERSQLAWRKSMKEAREAQQAAQSPPPFVSAHAEQVVEVTV